MSRITTTLAGAAIAATAVTTVAVGGAETANAATVTAYGHVKPIPPKSSCDKPQRGRPRRCSPPPVTTTVVGGAETANAATVTAYGHVKPRQWIYTGDSTGIIRKAC